MNVKLEHGEASLLGDLKAGSVRNLPVHGVTDN
jgi:hypothetical protein